MNALNLMNIFLLKNRCVYLCVIRYTWKFKKCYVGCKIFVI